MRTPSRLVAWAAGTSLALTGLVAVPSSAGAAIADPTPVDQGVSWLAKQSFYNAGARIDFLQQLTLLGKTAEAARQIEAIKTGAAAYAKTAEARAKVVYAGDLAKQDAATWGAGDLVAGVADGVNDDTGGVEGEYVTPASQALAVRALGAFNGRTEHAEYAAARDFLIKQQCADGHYRDAMAASSCDADSSGGSADATAFVALYLADSADSAVQASVDKARAWLKTSQNADGSWSSPDQAQGPGMPNTNSTGLSALAVGAGAEANRAALWLRTIQARDAGTCTRKLGPDRGAIAFTPLDYTAGDEEGLDESQFTRGSWVIATQQSVAAMRFAPSNPGALALTGSSAYLKAGTTQRLTARNLAPLAKGCLTGPGTKQSWTAGQATWLYRTITLPKTTGNLTYRLVDSAGRADTHVVKVLGPATFSVAERADPIRRGATQRLVVRGMAPGERVLVYYKGTKIRTATASAYGTYVTTFGVGSQTGKQQLAVRGQFGDTRRGSTTFTVVR